VNRPAFDRVVVHGANGSRREFSAADFLALPLHQRIHYVLGREIEFFLGEAPVDRAGALRSLRR
jgi:hypothetical protein